MGLLTNAKPYCARLPQLLSIASGSKEGIFRAKKDGAAAPRMLARIEQLRLLSKLEDLKLLSLLQVQPVGLYPIRVSRLTSWVVRASLSVGNQMWEIEVFGLSLKSYLLLRLLSKLQDERQVGILVGSNT